MSDSAQPPGDERAGPTDEYADAAEKAANVDLTELTIKERIAVATVQQPTVGFSLVVLSLFALSFVVALAFVYPTVAVLFVIALLVIGLVSVGIFYAMRRSSSA